MLVCIAGMPRSGTSMVARLLGGVGLALGDPAALASPRDVEPDADPEGDGEHRDFVALNVDILDRLGGAWDLPPRPPADWRAVSALAPLRVRAVALLAQHATHAAFGWTDPRNALTLGFWLRVAPELRVVVCVRNPLAVAQSLRARTGCSDALGLALWRTYYERLLADTTADRRVVTHWDAWRDDPAAELRRVAGAVGLAPRDADVAAAVATMRPDDCPHRASTAQVLEHVRPPETADLYLRLCAEAGVVLQRAMAAECVGEGAEPGALPPASGAWLAGVLRARVARLEADARAHAAALEVLHAQRDVASETIAARDAELAETRAALHAARDELLATRAALHDYATTLTDRERALAQVRDELRDLGWRLDAITSSRAWRLLEAWWRLRGGGLPVPPRRP